MTDEPKYQGIEIQWSEPDPEKLCITQMPDDWPERAREAGVELQAVNTDFGTLYVWGGRQW